MKNIADCKYEWLNHHNTHAFSKLVNDYLQNAPELASFYQHASNDAGILAAIKAKSQQHINRSLLVDVLKTQYQSLETSPIVESNIALLLEKNTFSICTAHQPNLMTGHLYFIYKILHTVVLANHLKTIYPHYNFVPMYYLGSEDNDLEELGHFYFYGRDYTWNTNQTGAVGRMTTEDLQPLLQELVNNMGPQGPFLNEIKKIVLEAYQQKDISTATQYLVNALMGKYGVIVINADEKAFKQQYINVIKDDILHHTPASIVRKTNEKLAINYGAQAFVRDINVFYIKDNIRERIEQVGESYHVVNTDIVFTKEAIVAALEENPEHFSPNVILRGLYQETIMPNVAFIGGGSEVAYWMQLKGVFEHYQVPYPVIVLRQSILFIKDYALTLFEKLNIENEIIFKKVDEVIKSIAIEHNHTISISAYKNEIEKILNNISNVAQQINPNLEYSAGAVNTKIVKQLDVLQDKMIRAEKKKYDILREQLTALKNMLYPKGTLQERKENFLEYYLSYGSAYFDIVLNGIRPYGNQFSIIKIV